MEMASGSCRRKLLLDFNEQICHSRSLFSETWSYKSILIFGIDKHTDLQYTYLEKLDNFFVRSADGF